MVQLCIVLTHIKEVLPILKKAVSLWRIFCRGVTVHRSFGLSGLLVQDPNKYSIVLTTARVELHWKLPVLYIVTFEKKQSPIFRIMSIFQEIQTINAVLTLFDVMWQIAEILDIIFIISYFTC